MEKLAEKLIKDHRNPIVKLKLHGPKFLLPTEVEYEKQKEIEENRLSELQKILEHTRVNLKSARIKAEWYPQLNRAKVIKIVKSLLNNFGYQDKTGIYLYPEEALLLVELNRLELIQDNIPLSIQEIYDIVINSSNYNLNKYKVYKKLVLDGFRVIRYEEMIRRLNKFEEKPEISNEQSFSNQEETINEESSDPIASIFEKLKKNRPRLYVEENTVNSPDYYLFLLTNNSRTKANYNLYIKDCFPSSETGLNSDSNVFAICLEDSITFCIFNTTETPDLL